MQLPRLRGSGDVRVALPGVSLGEAVRYSTFRQRCAVQVNISILSCGGYVIVVKISTILGNERVHSHQYDHEKMV